LENDPIKNQMEIISYDSSAVQGYLSILQSVISRMSSNSAGCKTWCVTIISAMVVFILNKGEPTHIWIAMVPLFLFLILDSYYLGLERHFRQIYNNFIQKLHSNNVKVNDLYLLVPHEDYCSSLTSTIYAFYSLSIWPFYGLIAIMLIIVRIAISGK